MERQKDREGGGGGGRKEGKERETAGQREQGA